MPKTEKILTEAETQALKEAEWLKTLQRLGIQEPSITSIRPSDIAYLAERWQFLQVVELSDEKEPLEKPELITAKSGWTIINYGDAMATSPGKWIFRGGYWQLSLNEEDEGDGGIVNPGKGTIYKQAFDSAAELIQLAQKFEWAGVKIVDGHPKMQEAAWVEACRIGVRMEGYAADVTAEIKRRRIVSSTLDEMYAVIKGILAR